MNDVEHTVVEGIKIYTGTTKESREKYKQTIEYYKSLNNNNDKIFDMPVPSTLTAQGYMSNISFDESEIISMLTKPTGNIMLVGCNFGEHLNDNYVKPEPVVKSARGRKPNKKKKSNRVPQGNGKYFSSQITHQIKHPDSDNIYKIKLFRNGVFQVPGVKDPTIVDLIKPIYILRDYLVKNFDEDVQVLNFIAVMRNYKSKLINSNLRVDLVYLEDIINFYKSYKIFKPFLNHELKGLRPKQQLQAMKFVGKSNILNIAEINYNTDKCFCLNLKFYRPMPGCSTKKTTVKLLKKGKINFDGGNSEYEMLELYYWLEYIYVKYASEILIDSTKIKNIYNYAKLEEVCLDDAIYSGDELDKAEETKLGQS